MKYRKNQDIGLFDKENTLGGDVLYYPVGILHNDTLIVQGFSLKHTLLGQLKTGNDFFF